MYYMSSAKLGNMYYKTKLSAKNYMKSIFILFVLFFMLSLYLENNT